MVEEAIDYKEKYDELFISYTLLRQELDQLKRLIYGSRHERFVPATPQEQLSLSLPVEEKPAPATEVQQVEYTRTVNKEKSVNIPVRMKLPADLPREEVVIEPAEDVTGLKKIGEEITEELECIPGKFFVRRFVRPKYVRNDGQGIAIAQMPSRPIDKGIAGPGLLAQIVIDKYVDHLPVYRQLQRFERSGVKLPSSTLVDWISGTCRLLEPLYEVLRSQVLEAGYLQVDETPIKVLDKDKKGSTHRGYHWVYHSPEKRLVMFDYREGRGREGPGECLKDFTGYLQTDGYGVYEDYGHRKGIVLLHCMAHARRKFDQALTNDRERAEYMLGEFQKLYSIEREAREQGLSAADRLGLRQQGSLPVLEGMKAWMLEAYKAVLPKSAIGQALHYSLERWDKLMIYANDGRLEIDNNLIENSIRPVALGRKNYLFAGSHEGARRAAMLYSFLGTCKMNGINPLDWLRITLEKLPDHQVNRISELLPVKR